MKYKHILDKKKFLKQKEFPEEIRNFLNKEEEIAYLALIDFQLLLKLEIMSYIYVTRHDKPLSL